MCKVTISAFQMIHRFPDQESARLYIEKCRWNGMPVCPKCNLAEKQYPQNRKGRPGFYECRCCGLVYTVRTGTIFERSHIPLNKWIFAIYLVVTARKGISSMQLSKELGIGQKAAWFLLQRIRKACEDDNGGNGFLQGIVEIDEAYLGGLEANRHESKKKKAGRGPNGKEVALGMKERDGKVAIKHLPSSKGEHIRPEIEKTIAKGSTLCTDEAPVYEALQSQYDHKTVNHSAKQYVDGMAHTNSIESVWAVLKRAFYGVFHSFSAKHMQLYLNEVCFRFNSGNVKIHTLERLDSLLGMCFGKRLTWADCIA